MNNSNRCSITGRGRVQTVAVLTLGGLLGCLVAAGDAFEFRRIGADITSNTYYEWILEQGYFLFAASAVTDEFLKTSKEFPPRQRAASFTDQALEKMKQNLGGN